LTLNGRCTVKSLVMANPKLGNHVSLRLFAACFFLNRPVRISFVGRGGCGFYFEDYAVGAEGTSRDRGLLPAPDCTGHRRSIVPSGHHPNATSEDLAGY